MFTSSTIDGAQSQTYSKNRVNIDDANVTRRMRSRQRQVLMCNKESAVIQSRIYWIFFDLRNILYIKGQCRSMSKRTSNGPVKRIAVQGGNPNGGEWSRSVSLVVTHIQYKHTVAYRQHLLSILDSSLVY